MTSRCSWLSGFCWAVLASVALAAEPNPALEAFTELDANQDGFLSRQEYLARPGAKQEVLLRDFKLFDFSPDERLSFTEFAAIPGLVPAWQRGSLPDPFDELLQQAMESLEEAYGNWEKQPQRRIDAQQFVMTFLQSLDPSGPVSFNSALVALADANGDRQVDRADARRFMEIQLGIRGAKGELLREPTGRVVSMSMLLGIDLNKNGQLEKAEFLEKYTGNTPEAVFDRGDKNHDGIISLEEFLAPEWVAYDDVVEWFRKADGNLDALVDPDELLAAVPEYRKILVSAWPAFDDDKDGKLSLPEYQASIIANRICSWNNIPQDANRDGKLSFSEFRYDQTQAHLLRRLYFFRLDQDSDGVLSPTEFPFKVRGPNSVRILNLADGSLRQIFTNPDYPNCGSVAVSPDGKAIAFDGYRAGETTGHSKLFVMSIDGKDFREAGDGLMPTWSPDGQFLACSRQGSAENYGVWIKKLDGAPEKKIGGGWGAQWSPDGKTIVYYENLSILAYDVATGETRTVLARGAHPYRSLYWNMTWSPDSRRLAFKGSLPNGSDVASIAMQGSEPDLQVHLSTTQYFDADLNWSPDGSHIVVSMVSPATNLSQLQKLSVIQPAAPPETISGLPPNLNFSCGSYTPDGKQLVVVVKE